MLRDADGRLTVEITREQLEAWAGRALTDEQVARLDRCLPDSSIPEAVGTIAASMGDDDDGALPEDEAKSDDRCRECGADLSYLW